MVNALSAGVVATFPGAIADYKRVIELDPYVPFVYFYKGYAELMSGNVEGAMAEISLGDQESGYNDLQKAGDLGLQEALDIVQENLN